MKREIKFRGRRRDNGEWVVGSYTLIQDADGVWLEDTNLDMVKVMPETLGQFTGLTDMNGREIYEGDRVTWLRHRMDGSGFLEEGHVRFSVDEQRVFVVNRFTTMDDREMLHDIIRCRKHNLRVVGNIHDNPEAIE